MESAWGHVSCGYQACPSLISSRCRLVPRPASHVCAEPGLVELITPVGYVSEDVSDFVVNRPPCATQTVWNDLGTKKKTAIPSCTATCAVLCMNLQRFGSVIALALLSVPV